MNPALRTMLMHQARQQLSPTKYTAIVSSLKIPATRPLAVSVQRWTSPLALFHTSSKNFILPPLPQRIQGTANEAVPIHEPHPVHGSYHWVFERLVAIGLVPLTIAPFAAGSLNPVTDALFCGTILIHSHIGFQSIIIDYIPTKRLPRTRQVFWWGLNLATVLVGIGLYEFETHDVGVTEAVKLMWKA